MNNLQMGNTNRTSFLRGNRSIVIKEADDASISLFRLTLLKFVIVWLENAMLLARRRTLCDLKLIESWVGRKNMPFVLHCSITCKNYL
jgi:hypothetical protein